MPRKQNALLVDAKELLIHAREYPRRNGTTSRPDRQPARDSPQAGGPRGAHVISRVSARGPGSFLTCPLASRTMKGGHLTSNI
jgi:hypothetical protein